MLMRARHVRATITVLAVAAVSLAGTAASVAVATATERDSLLAVSLDDRGGLVIGGADTISPAGAGGTVPAHPAFAFLGDPGDAVWAVADPNAALSTWDTTGVPSGEVDGDITVELVGVDGPGEFHAYTLSAVGEPRVLFGTSPGVPERAELPAGHQHGGMVWAFDAPGTYHVDLEASAQLTGGATARADRTYQVVVPPFSEGATDLLGAPAAPMNLPGAPLAGAPLAGAPLAAEAGGERVVIADGHVDIGPRFVDDTWTIQVKDDTVSPLVWRNLSDVVLQVVEEAAMELPDGDFAFLGDPGDTVWLLPQTQVSGILWPGWNTEDSSVVERVSGATTWRLLDVDGPGDFVLFLTGSFGQAQVLFTTHESLPQSMQIPLRTHAHGNWAFTESGVYHLEIEMSASTTDGETVSDTRTLAFAVGDVDPNTAFPPGGNGGNGNGNGSGGNGNGGGGGAGGGNGGGGQMPKTGVSIIAAVAVALGLMLAGTALMRSRRQLDAVDQAAA